MKAIITTNERQASMGKLYGDATYRMKLNLAGATSSRAVTGLFILVLKNALILLFLPHPPPPEVLASPYETPPPDGTMDNTT